LVCDTVKSYSIYSEQYTTDEATLNKFPVPKIMSIYDFVVDTMINLGYIRKEIEDSLSQNKFDNLYATYHLLGKPLPDVSLKDGSNVFVSKLL